MLQRDEKVETRSAVPAGYMQDSAGRLVPLANVKPEHLLQDQLVRELHKAADESKALLERLKARGYAEIGALVELLAQTYGAVVGGERGNLTLQSYDGSLRVQIAIGDALSFGPELQAAKALIDNCLRRWTKGGNANLEALVTDAFDVGKEGKLRVDRILGLRRLSIEDEEWQRAMQAIADAVQVVATKRYIRFYRRGTPDAPYVQVPLDIARVAG